MSDKFERLLKIFQEISGVKTAADPKPRVEDSLKPHQEGKFDKQTSALMKAMYPTAPDVGESNVNTKTDASAANTDVRFTMEGPSDIVRTINEGNVNLKDYKLASMDDLSLRQLFIEESNKILHTVNSGTQVRATSQLPKTATAEQVQNAEVSPQDIDLISTNSDDLAFGILYGIQKQAEAHADLVGNYLINYLNTSLQTMAKAAASHEDSEEKAPMKGYKKTDDPAVEAAEERTGVDLDNDNEEGEPEEHKSKVMDGEKNEQKEQEMTKEDATEALAAMQGSDEEEALQSLGLALTELGITPEELAKAGSAGAKLASQFTAFRRQGKFRIEPVTTRDKRAAVDYIKGYVIELLNRSQK